MERRWAFHPGHTNPEGIPMKNWKQWAGILAVLTWAVAGAGMGAALAADEGLRVGLTDFGSEVFDPMLSASSNRTHLNPLFDALIGNDAKGKLSRERGIARDWKVTKGAGSTTYTIYLRQGVKFHNGAPVTSADVKYGIERFQSPDAASTFKSTLENVAAIETPDDHTLVIRTKKPYGFLLYDLSNVKGTEGFVMPKGYLEKEGAARFNRFPIGTGPYRFVRHDPGNRLEMEAFADYWGEKPKYKTLSFIMMPEETTRIAALKSGGVDIIAVSRQRLKEVAAFRLISKPGSALTWNGFVQVSPDSIFSDIRVRKALNVAINREEIRDYIYEGQAQITGGVSYGTLAVGYQDLPPYPYDPDTARKLLKEVYPNGVEVTMYQYARSGSPEMPRVTEAISGYWEAIGVRTRIVPLDYGTVRKNVVDKKMQNAFVSWRVANQPFMSGVLHLLYHSRGKLTSLSPAPAELDRLLEELNT
jgi:peptide/nickel transport system substrate-binding protein